MNDKFAAVLAHSAVDTHAMDRPARDSLEMNPSVSDLPFNDLDAIVNDVVKVNTVLQLCMIYFIKNFQVY